MYFRSRLLETSLCPGFPHFQLLTFFACFIMTLYIAFNSGTVPYSSLSDPLPPRSTTMYRLGPSCSYFFDKPLRMPLVYHPWNTRTNLRIAHYQFSYLFLMCNSGFLPLQLPHLSYFPPVLFFFHFNAFFFLSTTTSLCCNSICISFTSLNNFLFSWSTSTKSISIIFLHVCKKA